MKDLLEIFGDIPLTLGTLIGLAIFSYLLIKNAVKILKIYNDLERNVDIIKSVADGEKIGNISARLAKLENDLNNVAKKSRQSDRNLLQHINSHCSQISHIGAYLQTTGNYHPPTKLNLPEDMI